jgi:hypothetical protein
MKFAQRLLQLIRCRIPLAVPGTFNGRPDIGLRVEADDEVVVQIMDTRLGRGPQGTAPGRQQGL